MMRQPWAMPQINEIYVKETEHGFGWGNDGKNGKDNSQGQNPNPGTSSGGSGS